MATADVQSLLLRIDASTELARRELVKLDAPLESLGTTAEASVRRFSGAMSQVERSSARVANAQRNLGFQIQDISAQLGSGQSPFTILAQQAGQTASAVADLGGAVGKIGTFLAGPWGSIIIAATAILGNLATQHFLASDAVEKQETAEDRLKAAIKELNDVTGVANVTQEERFILAVRNAEAELRNAEATRETIKEKLELIDAQRRLNSTFVSAGGAGLTQGAQAAAGFREASLQEQLARQDRLIAAARLDFGLAVGSQKVFGLGGRSSAGNARLSRAGGGGSAARAVAPFDLQRETFPGGALPIDRKVANLGFGAQAELANQSLRETAALLQQLETYNFSIEPIPDRAVEAAAQFNENLSRGLGQAIVQGQSLGDALVNSIKAAAAELISSGLLRLLTGATGGGGGIFGALFGGFFATGGRPPMGRISVVGERGPELFVPSVPGEVIPNYKLAGAMGGGQTGVNVSVEPSPLFITTVTEGAAAVARQEAGAAIAGATRRRMAGARGI